MDLPRGNRKINTKVFSGEQSNGPVYQNHEQVRDAKAEPDDSHDAMMDSLETAPIPSEENEKVNPNEATMNQLEKQCPANLRAYWKAHCCKQQNVDKDSGNRNIDGLQGSKISYSVDFKTVAQYVLAQKIFRTFCMHYVIILAFSSKWVKV